MRYDAASLVNALEGAAIGVETPLEVISGIREKADRAMDDATLDNIARLLNDAGDLLDAAVEVAEGKTAPPMWVVLWLHGGLLTKVGLYATEEEAIAAFEKMTEIKYDEWLENLDEYRDMKDDYWLERVWPGKETSV